MQLHLSILEKASIAPIDFRILWVIFGQYCVIVDICTHRLGSLAGALLTYYFSISRKEFVVESLEEMFMDRKIKINLQSCEVAGHKI